MNRSNSANESPSVDEKRANYERFSMTVLDGDGSGWVNIRNTSYDGGNHAYSVQVEDGEAVGCSCPHATHRDAHCKHQCAVEDNPLVISSASAADETRVMTDGGEESEGSDRTDVLDSDDDRGVVDPYPDDLDRDDLDDTPL